MVTAIVLLDTKRGKVNEVADEIRQVEGITDTETLIGFRVHSSHDLENMFGIGMD